MGANKTLPTILFGIAAIIVTLILLYVSSANQILSKNSISSSSSSSSSSLSTTTNNKFQVNHEAHAPINNNTSAMEKTIANISNRPINNSKTITNTASTPLKTINHPPIANAGQDQLVNGNSIVTLDGTESIDPDLGDKISSYSWTQTAGPHIMLKGVDTPIPTFRAPNMKSDTILRFDLTVTDSNGAISKPNSVDLIVMKINQPPKANAGPDNKVVERTDIMLNGSGTDPNPEDKLTYSWKQIAGPNVDLSSTSSNTNTSHPTFIAPSFDPNNSVLTFQLVVNDGIIDSKPDTVSIIIEPKTTAATNQTTITTNSLVILSGASTQGNPSFDPNPMTVKKGDTIQVQNKDQTPHTVTSGIGPDDPAKGKLFDTSIISPGVSAKISTTNINPGEYPFHCEIHPYMTGMLIIMPHITR
jgi:plastocyanin